jgi:hypothetical protein
VREPRAVDESSAPLAAVFKDGGEAFKEAARLRAGRD